MLKYIISTYQFKRLKQTNCAFAARERAVLQAHGFEHLFQVRGHTKVREITVN